MLIHSAGDLRQQKAYDWSIKTRSEKDDMHAGSRC